VIGLEVPHAHIHLIPITREGDMLFTNPRVSLPKEENEKLAREIGAHVRL
jgi:histidine triad (HIT) family protein